MKTRFLILSAIVLLKIVFVGTWPATILARTIVFDPVAPDKHTISKDITKIKISELPGATTVYFYQKRRDIAGWHYIDKDTAPVAGIFEVDWDISGLLNNTYYEVRAKVEYPVGFPTDLYNWCKIDRDPVVEIVGIERASTLDGPFSPVPVWNGKRYIKEGVVRIHLHFRGWAEEPKPMNVGISPTATLTPEGKTGLTITTSYWYTIKVASDTWVGIVHIPERTHDGECVLTVSGARDTAGNIMEPYSRGGIIIDTIDPFVTSIRIDEDGDGIFTDNNGYINKWEQPKFYFNFSEFLTSTPTAVFTPYGKPVIGLGYIKWISTGLSGYFTFPFHVNELTGDGMANIYIIGHGVEDRAKNILKSTYVYFRIDGTPPMPPIISTPTPNMLVRKNSLVFIALEDPPEPDIDYAIFREGGFDRRDYTKPYSAMIVAVDPGLGVRFVDKAGNVSEPTVIPLNLLPEIDKTPPRAKLVSISPLPPPLPVPPLPLTHTLTANVNDNNENIKQIKFQYSPDRINWHDIGIDIDPSAGWTCVWDVAPLADGIYYIRTIATDKNDNIDPEPVITIIKKSEEGVVIEKKTATYYPPFKVNTSINPHDYTITINVNSKTKPIINIELSDMKIHRIILSDISVTGSPGNYTATVSIKHIEKGGRGVASIIVVDEQGQTQSVVRHFVFLPIDHKQSYEFAGLSIPANALTSDNTLILEPVDDVPSGGEDLIILSAFNIRWLKDIDKLVKPVEVDWYYSTINDMFMNSTAELPNFTVCYWNGNKWIKDNNIQIITRHRYYIKFKTLRTSMFAIAADYSKPRIKQIDFSGSVLYGKIEDTGAGIRKASTTLTIDGRTIWLDGPRGEYDETTGDFSIRVDGLRPGVYPYTFTVEDEVGNRTTYMGTLNYTGLLEVKDVHNYPNPFNPDKEETKIRFMLSQSQNVRMNIFDFNGELVYSVGRYFSAGAVEIPWAGVDNQGRKVSNGVYFCQLKIGDKVETFKIAVLRR